MAKEDGPVQCLYFKTIVDEKTDGKAKQSDRYCISDKAQKDGDAGKLNSDKTTTVPLWNVKSITTEIHDTNGIVSMNFKMRYTNTSDPNGFY